jgi:chromosome segregation ATPase
MADNRSSLGSIVLLLLAAVIFGMAWLAWDLSRKAEQLGIERDDLAVEVQSASRRLRILDEDVIGQKRYAEHLREKVQLLEAKLSACGRDLTAAREEARSVGAERDSLLLSNAELSRRLERAMSALAR